MKQHTEQKHTQDSLVKALLGCLEIMSYYHKTERGHLDSCEIPENCGHCKAVRVARAAIAKTEAIS